MPTIEEIDNWVNEVQHNYRILIERAIAYLKSNNLKISSNIKLPYGFPRTC